MHSCFSYRISYSKEKIKSRTASLKRIKKKQQQQQRTVSLRKVPFWIGFWMVSKKYPGGLGWKNVSMYVNTKQNNL